MRFYTAPTDAVAVRDSTISSLADTLQRDAFHEREPRTFSTIYYIAHATHIFHFFNNLCALCGVARSVLRHCVSSSVYEAISALRNRAHLKHALPATAAAVQSVSESGGPDNSGTAVIILVASNAAQTSDAFYDATRRERSEAQRMRESAINNFIMIVLRYVLGLLLLQLGGSMCHVATHDWPVRNGSELVSMEHIYLGLFCIHECTHSFADGEKPHGHTADALFAPAEARCPSDAALSQLSHSNATEAIESKLRKNCASLHIAAF